LQLHAAVVLVLMMFNIISKDVAIVAIEAEWKFNLALLLSRFA